MSQSTGCSSPTNDNPIVMVINGFPGVGKLTVAKELSRVVPKAKVFDNHLLIDAAAALYNRDNPAYQPLRKSLRSAIFKSLQDHPASRPRILIFTECQSNDSEGSCVMEEYLQFASSIECLLVSVILECSPTENASRLMHHDRGAGDRTKLMDLDILRQMREKAVIHRYNSRADVEIEIDTTGKSSVNVATRLKEQIAEIINI